MKWKRRASKVVVVDVMLAKYDTLFKEHALLKLEAIVWRQKTRKKEARWDEFKGGLNVIINIIPLLTLIDEATYYQQLTTYVQAFLNFKADGAHNTSSSSDGHNAKSNPHHELTF